MEGSKSVGVSAHPLQGIAIWKRAPLGEESKRSVLTSSPERENFAYTLNSTSRGPRHESERFRGVLQPLTPHIFQIRGAVRTSVMGVAGRQ